MQFCILEKLLYGKPGYLAYLLSGKAVIGQVCYLAIVQICHPFSGKSVIWQISYLEYLLSGTYVICKYAFWKSCFMVNLVTSGIPVIRQRRHRASISSCKRAHLSSVIWQNCYLANPLFGIPVTASNATACAASSGPPCAQQAGRARHAGR